MAWCISRQLYSGTKKGVAGNGGGKRTKLVVFVLVLILIVNKNANFCFCRQRRPHGTIRGFLSDVGGVSFGAVRSVVRDDSLATLSGTSVHSTTCASFFSRVGGGVACGVAEGEFSVRGNATSIATRVACVSKAGVCGTAVARFLHRVISGTCTKGRLARRRARTGLTSVLGRRTGGIRGSMFSRASVACPIVGASSK